MKIRTLSLLLLVVLAAASSARAQQLLWGADFDFYFDNREYDRMSVASQTLFAVRLTPSVGIGWGERHSLMAGVDVMKRMGKNRFSEDPQLVLYYRYATERLRVTAGIFPRHMLRGDYSRAIFSDSLRYFDNNFDGGLFQWIGRKGYFEAGIDWDGMQSPTEREKFRLFSAGRWQHRALVAGYALSVYHFAGSTNVRGVVDQIVVNPYVGVDLGGVLPFDRFDVHAGWIQTVQRDRITGRKGVHPGGVEIDVRIEKWSFGLSNTLFLGDGLMPYYATYGSELYAGEPFYRNMGDAYNRTELYYARTWGRQVPVSLHAGVMLQYDGRRLGTQQMLRLTVHIAGRGRKVVAEE